MVHQAFQYYKSIELVDNFHCYIWQGTGINCNSCLFTNVLRGEHPHVLIDPGIGNNAQRENCLSQLSGAIETDGFKIDDVGLIINTHSHRDHCSAVDDIIEKNGAKVAMSEEEEGFHNTLGQGIYSTFGEKPPAFTPFFYLKEGQLNLGAQDKVELQVLLAPGHTPGSVCLYWLEKKVLITGDVVFYGSIGRTDLPGGSMSELKKSINKLSQLDVEYLIPGHSTEYGDIIRGKQNVQRNFQAIKLFV